MASNGEHGELLAAFVRGDGAAFVRLVDAYQDRLYNFALRLTGCREDAEEVVQDALLKAHRALHGRLTPERILNLALTPWLYRIVLNTARNRRRCRRLPTTSLDDGEEAVGEGAAADKADEPVRTAEIGDLRSALVRELTRLPERYRVAILLRYVEGLSYAEIAQATGRPQGTVKSDVHRGALLMRSGLAPWWKERCE